MRAMRGLLPIAGAALACVAAYWLAGHWTIRASAQSQISVQPFTLEVLTFDSAGKLVEDRVTARRSDGSEAWIRMDRGSVAARRIDFTDGAIMTLLDAMQVRMSGWASPERLAAQKFRLTQPPPNCLYPGDTLLDNHASLGGVPVITAASVRGSHRDTSYRALSLSCKALAAKGEDQQPDGSWRTRFEARFVSIKLAEPDARAFARGDSYREMAPSKLRDFALKEAGVTRQSCPACFAASVAQLDGQYNAAQRPPH
jgi:hypothetical protein